MMAEAVAMPAKRAVAASKKNNLATLRPGVTWTGLRGRSPVLIGSEEGVDMGRAGFRATKMVALL